MCTHIYPPEMRSSIKGRFDSDGRFQDGEDYRLLFHPTTKQHTLHLFFPLPLLAHREIVRVMTGVSNNHSILIISL